MAVSMRLFIVLASALLPGCAAMISHPKPAPEWCQRTGQVRISGTELNLVADIVIRHDANHFLAEITKGPGVYLVKLSAEFATPAASPGRMLAVRATGPLARSGWTIKPRTVTGATNPNPKIRSRPWAALPEVFQWGEMLAKGGRFDAVLPDVSKRAEIDNRGVLRFEYHVHENPTRRVPAPQELAKLPVAESVVCILEK
jgi:hypothetical protein